MPEKNIDKDIFYQLKDKVLNKVQKLYHENNETMLEIEKLVYKYDDLMIGVVHRDLKLENILIERDH